jgi:hypothetical protein
LTLALLILALLILAATLRGVKKIKIEPHKRHFVSRRMYEL